MMRYILRLRNGGTLIPSLAACSFFASTLFFFGPSNIYFTNLSEFNFPYVGEIPLLSALTLGAAALLTMVISLLNDPLNKRVVCLIFGVSFLLWLQGNILVRDIGLLDGKGINWEAVSPAYMTFEVVAWIGVISLVMIKATPVYAWVKKMSIFFIVVQIVSLGVTVIRAPKEPVYKKYFFDDKDQFSFSSRGNVIVLLLDMFQTDVFQEIIDTDARYKDIFTGFTYFRNSLGGFPTTYGSVTFLLTGQQYDNSIPFHDFMKNAFTSESSLPAVLKKNGYKVDLHEYPHIVYIDESIADNAILKETTDVKNLAYRSFFDINLFDVVLFRHVPHAVKKLINVNSSWKQPDDREFLKELASKIKVDTGHPEFKYYHLSGVHTPFQFNERLESEELTDNRTGYKKQAMGELEIVRRVLDNLKKNGVFDKSMIFIIGDHGFPWQGVGMRVMKGMAYADDNTVHEIPEHIVGSAVPLVLVKPFGATGEMKISNAPVSLSDIPKTIFSALRIKNNAPGYSLFDIEEGSDRLRRFFYYDNTFDGIFFGKLEEYEVSGFSWSNSSWKKTYRTFASSGVANSPPPVYRYGEEIRFGVNGNAREYASGGWDIPHETATWADGTKASLSIPVNAPATDLELKASLLHFLNNGNNPQRVLVSINGQRAGDWMVSSSGDYSLTVPKKLISGNRADVIFSLPDAVSPKALGINTDTRVLSVGFNSLLLTEKRRLR